MPRPTAPSGEPKSTPAMRSKGPPPPPARPPITPPEAISARKAKEYARRKVRDRERLANDPAFAAKVKAKKAAVERKRLERNRAAKEEAARAKLREVAEGIAAEARTKRAERGLQRVFDKAQREARKASSGGDK